MGKEAVPYIGIFGRMNNGKEALMGFRHGLSSVQFRVLTLALM